MNKSYRYEIRVRGQMSGNWSDWFGGLVVYNDCSGETLLSGHLPDQAAVFGVLSKIQALNLTLISVISFLLEE